MVPLRSCRCEKTPSKSNFWAAKPTKKSQKEEGEGAEEVNNEGGRHSLLSSGRCRIMGGDWVKSGHVTTGKAKGGKDLCQGPFWPGRKDMQCRGMGGSMGDLPNVTGRSKELQGSQTLSSSARKKKTRHKCRGGFGGGRCGR
jgi:hypothetical protein